MTVDLKTQAVSAMGWSGMQWICTQSIHFVIGIVLARLLVPEKFGLIGMLAIFMALGRIFADSGLGMALIQRKNPSHRDCSTIFYFNIVVGFLAAGLLCLAAPAIAAFFGEPILKPLTRFLSLYIVFSSFSVVQSSLLTGKLNFRLLGLVTVFSGLCSGVIAVIMAFRGFGVWSLAVQQVSAGVINAAMLWFFNSWRPTWEFSLVSLREMFKFASKLLAIGLMDVIFGNLYSVVIGRSFSPSALGLYSKAQTLTQLPAQGLTGVAGGVLFPALSSIQNDKTRMKRGLKKTLLVLCVLTFPLMVGVAVIARPLVSLLLGSNWLPSIVLAQLMCLIGLFYPLLEVNVRPLQSLGRSDLLLRLEVFKKVLLVINVVITYRWGITAMVAGQVVHMAASYGLNAYYVGKQLAYPLREQLRDIAPVFGAALVMGLGAYGIGLIFPPAQEAWRMLAQICAGILLFLGLGTLLKFGGFEEVMALIEQRTMAFRKKVIR